MGSLWGELPTKLRSACEDTEEAVRKSAIAAVMDLATQCPSRVPESLLVAVGKRVMDRRPAVAFQPGPQPHQRSPQGLGMVAGDGVAA